MDVLNAGKMPKRGDLLHTNIGSKRERTWMILRARRIKSASNPLRFDLLAARWWELEPEMRLRLYASSVRNGGQVVWSYVRYPVKKKKIPLWP
jgi:hypothetical protein